MVIRLLAVLALVATAATVAFMAGHATVKRPDTGFRRGYAAGLRVQGASTAAQVRTVRAHYARGHAGYNAIYRAGRREGRRLGLRLGRSEGLTTARRRGGDLPAFAGGWRAQHWYLVRIEPGRRAGTVSIGERVVVARGRLYGPCRVNPDHICAAPQT